MAAAAARPQSNRLQPLVQSASECGPPSAYQVHTVAKVFRSLDVRGGGIISAQDLADVLGSEKAQATLALLDRDGDGLLYWEDFALALQGRRFSLEGLAPRRGGPGGEDFAVNWRGAGADILFHLNVRQSEGQVVLNSRFNLLWPPGGWGEEERVPVEMLGIRHGERFQVTVTVTAEGFLLGTKEMPLVYAYRHRRAIEELATVEVVLGAGGDAPLEVVVRELSVDITAAAAADRDQSGDYPQ